MKCLLVVAHPLEESLCHHFQRIVEDTLRSHGHNVQLEDLYAQAFDPVLSATERSAYYIKPYEATAVSKELERLKQAEALVLLFPTWWFGFPAILKGWFDRVWAPGHAYDHADDLGPIKPRLERLQQVLVVTTLGAPWWVDTLVMRQPVRRIIKTALLGACARQSKLQFLALHNAEKVTPGQVQQFTNRIRKALQHWTTAE